MVANVILTDEKCHIAETAGSRNCGLSFFENTIVNQMHSVYNKDNILAKIDIF